MLETSFLSNNPKNIRNLLKIISKSFGGSEKSRTFASAFALKTGRGDIRIAFFERFT